MLGCLQVGTVRGEDWNFQFSGKIVDGILHFRLQMQYEGDDTEQVQLSDFDWCSLAFPQTLVWL